MYVRQEYFPADMVEVQRIITCETTHTVHEAVLRQERHDLISGDLAAASSSVNLILSRDSSTEFFASFPV